MSPKTREILVCCALAAPPMIVLLVVIIASSDVLSGTDGPSSAARPDQAPTVNRDEIRRVVTSRLPSFWGLNGVREQDGNVSIDLYTLHGRNFEHGSFECSVQYASTLEDGRISVTINGKGWWSGSALFIYHGVNLLERKDSHNAFTSGTMPTVQRRVDELVYAFAPLVNSN